MIKIGICDDEAAMVDKISEKVKLFFKEYSYEIQLTVFTDSSQADEVCRKVDFDVFFLDIDMPGLSGFEVAERIRSYNQSMTIIFVSSHENMVFKAFQYDTFRFVRKEVLDTEFDEVLKSFLCRYQNRRKQQIFETKEGTKNIYIRDVSYVEAFGHDIVFHMNDGSTVTLKTRSASLNQLEKEWNQYGFIRIHKSYLLNYKELYTVGKQQLA